MSSEGLPVCGRTLPVSTDNSSTLALRLGASGTCEWRKRSSAGSRSTSCRASAHLLNLKAASTLLVCAADGRIFIDTTVEDTISSR